MDLTVLRRDDGSVDSAGARCAANRYYIDISGENNRFRSGGNVNFNY